MVIGNEDSLSHARLHVSSSGREVVFELTAASVSLGRDAANDIRIESDVVSGMHARLVREGATYRYVAIGKTNPTLLGGVPVDGWVLRDGDELQIAPGTRAGVTIRFELSQDRLQQTILFRQLSRHGFTRSPEIDAKRLVLPAEGTLTIGRSPACDLVLPSLTVSRLHARLDIDQGNVRLSDERSANGTYVNGVRIETRQLSASDIVRIGPYKLTYQRGAIEHYDDSRSVRLDVHRVTRTIGHTTILSAVSFSALPGEVCAIAGMSGAGKSTLMKALNGMQPPTSGRILVNGVDLNRSYDALRPLIGYVPQDTILPAQLTLRRALHFVAMLRLPSDVSQTEADERVESIMSQLDLVAARNVPIASLSGGEQKRASVAAELISNPGLFFLDEPTSGLDPGLAERVLAIIRDLADRGSTIVMISHDVEHLQAADRIVFLGGGGRVAFVGTLAGAREYFSADTCAAIYARLNADAADAWERRLQESGGEQAGTAPTQTFEGPEARDAEHGVRWDPAAIVTGATRRSPSVWRQWRIVTARYVEGTLRDRRNLLLLLAQAPIIAILILLMGKPTDLSPPPAELIARAAAFNIAAADLSPILPLAIAASATWFGTINAAREIVKELPVFRRERLSGLRVAPYVGSKFIVLTLVCLIQTVVLVGIVGLKVNLPSSGALMWGPLEIWITLSLTAFAALGLGLVVSASVENADRAQSLVPIVLIPQFVLVGGPHAGILGRWLSYLTITHWSVQALDISSSIPYRVAPGGFGSGELAERWAVLLAMTLAFVLLAGWQVQRRGNR